ncbi:MAG TPA: hypothetical protein PK926_09475 [Spirochaetota bacterium]|nr:hypothetical protein [Spirochaetota bacterium]HPI90711.1 hypothetical protein [Spirochaetota bacterium]
MWGETTSLVPTITHTGESIAPASDIANDFSEPQTYTVQAEDGSTQAYEVTVTVQEYSIGDYGPAGGKIFYINANAATEGWKYLETALEDIDSGNAKQWGGYGYEIETDTAIGTGKTNTTAIVEFHDGLNPDYYTNNFSTNIIFTNPSCFFTSDNNGTVAAKECSDYSVVNNGQTYNDWFLPSEAELDAIWDNLVNNGSGGNNGVGNFYEDYYWTSSERGSTYSDDQALTQSFDDGWQDYSSKYAEHCVRAIRAF